MSKITPKKKASNVKKWIKALCSGEYKRGVDALISYDTNDNSPQYCCLGVACDLVRDRVPREAYLSEKVRGEFGLRSVSGDFFSDRHGHDFHNLAGMNDSCDYSFKKIARAILIHKDCLFVEEVAKLLPSKIDMIIEPKVKKVKVKKKR